MTQPTRPDRPAVEPIAFDDDPGLVPVTLKGKSFTVSPMEELRLMRKFAEPRLAEIPNDKEHADERGEIYLLAVRDWIKKQHDVDVSPDFAGAYHKKLEAANLVIMDFFGLRLNSPTPSDSTPDSSAEQQSGLTLDASDSSEPSNPSETSETPTLSPETNTSSN
jgi:hypothetical protein